MHRKSIDAQHSSLRDDSGVSDPEDPDGELEQNTRKSLEQSNDHSHLSSSTESLNVVSPTPPTSSLPPSSSPATTPTATTTSTPSPHIDLGSPTSSPIQQQMQQYFSNVSPTSSHYNNHNFAPPSHVRPGHLQALADHSPAKQLEVGSTLQTVPHSAPPQPPPSYHPLLDAANASACAGAASTKDFHMIMNTAVAAAAAAAAGDIYGTGLVQDPDTFR